MKTNQPRIEVGSDVNEKPSKIFLVGEGNVMDPFVYSLYNWY